MAKAESNDFYLAFDVFTGWKKRVTEASTSITVFSPYIDTTLLKPLSSSKLQKSDIIVVTDFNPESILENQYQLRAIKKLEAEGN
jgi:hypothetical protein